MKIGRYEIEGVALHGRRSWAIDKEPFEFRVMVGSYYRAFGVEIRRRNYPTFWTFDVFLIWWRVGFCVLVGSPRD